MDFYTHNEISESKNLQKSHLKLDKKNYLEINSANLHADQEATVRTGHGTADWFQIGKGVPRGCHSGLEQQLHGAGVTVRRYPTSKGREAPARL